MYDLIKICCFVRGIVPLFVIVLSLARGSTVSQHLELLAQIKSRQMVRFFGRGTNFNYLNYYFLFQSSDAFFQARAVREMDNESSAALETYGMSR